MGFSRQEFWSGVPLPSPSTTSSPSYLLIHFSAVFVLSFIPLKHFISTIIYSLIFTGEGNGTPLQYSCLENHMDRGAWWAAVYGVANSWTQLSDFTFTFHFHALEKEMAGESQGQRSLLGCCLWGHTESDMTEAT